MIHDEFRRKLSEQDISWVPSSWIRDKAPTGPLYDPISDLSGDGKVKAEERRKKLGLEGCKFSSWLHAYYMHPVIGSEWSENSRGTNLIMMNGWFCLDFDEPKDENGEDPLNTFIQAVHERSGGMFPYEKLYLEKSVNNGWHIIAHGTGTLESKDYKRVIRKGMQTNEKKSSSRWCEPGEEVTFIELKAVPNGALKGCSVCIWPSEGYEKVLWEERFYTKHRENLWDLDPLTQEEQDLLMEVCETLYPETSTTKKRVEKKSPNPLEKTSENQPERRIEVCGRRGSTQNIETPRYRMIYGMLPSYRIRYYDDFKKTLEEDGCTFTLTEEVKDGGIVTEIKCRVNRPGNEDDPSCSAELTAKAECGFEPKLHVYTTNWGRLHSEGHYSEFAYIAATRYNDNFREANQGLWGDTVIDPKLSIKNFKF